MCKVLIIFLKLFVSNLLFLFYQFTVAYIINLFAILSSPEAEDFRRMNGSRVGLKEGGISLINVEAIYTLL